LLSDEGRMAWQQFLILASAHFLALLSPGPDFFLLLNQSLVHGRRAGYRTALGIACANGVFILAALCGVAWLQASPLAYAVMFWTGCGYLAWLAWQFLRATPSAIEADAAPRKLGPSAAFARGFASAILNPKNAVFYLTLFTVLAGKDSTTLARGLAGIWMFLAVLAWDCLVSWLFTQARVLAAFSGRQTLINRASAWVLFSIVGGMVLSQV
jgi:threonine/homoserine/homoserine lactone efflux protein